MSLFENSEYEWRETYFVLFPEGRRPTSAELRRLLKSIGDRFEITQVRSSDGDFEQLTVISPQDFAGLDIAYNAGEDVVAQVEDLIKDLSRSTLTREERDKLKRIKDYTARFEVFHFEHVGGDRPAGEEDYLDPGGLLIILEKLAQRYRGVAIDPQAGAFL